jgi:hypothetical protein
MKKKSQAPCCIFAPVFLLMRTEARRLGRLVLHLVTRLIL